MYIFYKGAALRSTLHKIKAQRTSDGVFRPVGYKLKKAWLCGVQNPLKPRNDNLWIPKLGGVELLLHVDIICVSCVLY